MFAYKVSKVRQLDDDYLPRVPLSVSIFRESVPSADYLAEVMDPATGGMLMLFLPTGPATQWFQRSAIYREVLVRAYELSEPRLGVMRWPTLSESTTSLAFNLTEQEGGSQIPTVPARIEAAASVARMREAREVVVIERMDDGQWRVAGQGETLPDGMSELELEVTASGTLYAVSVDRYGTLFVPTAPVAVGDLIRPTRFAGWLYRVTEPGQLPAVEPDWWAIEGDNPSRPVGTARAVAVRYFRPLAHGPVTVEMI